MANQPGDSPSGYGGLPQAPTITDMGYTGLMNALSQLNKVILETLPYLARRLATDTDLHRGTGRVIK